MEPTTILPDGQYTIFNKGNDFVVGRKLAEDRSLRPKGVYTLDPSVGTDGGRLWTLEHIGDGKYKMMAGGAPVGDYDNLLWAFLTEQEQSTAGEWRIQAVPQMGQDCYIIVRPDMLNGWAATMDEDADQKQIAIRPLIVQPSYPPRYPLFEVFVIKRVDYD